MKLDKALLDMAAEEGLRVVTDDLASSYKYVYPMGCPPIDIPLGGGVVGGRIIEVIGEESHGKTTVALQMTMAFASFWKALKDDNYVVLWIESESTLDLARAQFMGCPVNKILIYETDIFEHGRDKIKSMLLRCKKKGLKLFIVWDTIAATSTLNEKEVADLIEEEDQEEGKKKKTNTGGLVEKPRLIRQMFRDITVDLGQTNSTFIVVNQMTTQIGKYMAPLDSSGGKGLRHHASIRMRIARVDDGKEEILPNGKRIVKSIICEIRYLKNKLTGFTHIPTVIYINKDTGIDFTETRMFFLKENKIIPAAAGGWTTVKIPLGYADKTKLKDGKPFLPGFTDIKWNNTAAYEKLVSEKYPHLTDWYDYQIYLSYGAMSSLIKAKIIDKIWAYEDKFFGEMRTTLTPKEREVADIMFKELIAKQDKENEDIKKREIKEAKAKPPTKASPKEKNATATTA